MMKKLVWNNSLVSLNHNAWQSRDTIKRQQIMNGKICVRLVNEKLRRRTLSWENGVSRESVSLLVAPLVLLPSASTEPVSFQAKLS